MTTQTEPAYGRYTDKNHLPGDAGFWEHGPQGWRWYNRKGDPEPGGWRPFREVDLYSPFTPLGPDQSEQERDLEIRSRALQAAVRSFPGKSPETTIEVARAFEEYLRGN